MFLFWIFTCFALSTQLKAGISRVENLLVIAEDTDTSVESYWEVGSSDNDPNGDKNTMSVNDVIAGGNFRSALVDDWFLEPPQQAALLLFNRIGDLHFWMIFDTTNCTSELIRSWMTMNCLKQSSLDVQDKSQLSESWNENGYQYIVYSSPIKDKAWFAIADRHLRNENNTRPYFVIPAVIGVPFRVVDHNETVSTEKQTFLRKFTSYNSQYATINLGSVPVYVTGIKLEELYLSRTFTIEYSKDECSYENRSPYLDLITNSLKIFGSSRVEALDLFSVKCLWITVDFWMIVLNIEVYAQIPTDDFQTIPIALIRGFWFSHLIDTSETINHLLFSESGTQTTTDVSTSEAQTCRCPCTAVQTTLTYEEIEAKIEWLKSVLRVNKTQLSSYKRAHISIKDSRASSKYLGYFAVGVLVTCLLIVVLSDLPLLANLFSRKSQRI